MEQDKNWLDTAIMGAICGDVVGSIYEWDNILFKLKEHELLRETSRFTDDTVMTCAVARGLTRGLKQLGENWMENPLSETILFKEVQETILEFGLRYPEAGYGSSFIRWMHSSDHAPYNSWGNGSAMRASYAGWLGQTLKEAETLAEISAKVTHNHPEGIKGGKVVAGCIYLLRQGNSKAEVLEYVTEFYDMDFTLDSIRGSYAFDVSCQGSVPQAIQAFLEEDSFVGAISNAISIGGDSDTLAAIAGSLAEVIYPIPTKLRYETAKRLDNFLLDTIKEANQF